MGKKFTLVLILLPLFVVSSVSLFAQKSLGFGSGSTNLAVAPGFRPVPTAGADATIEFWVYVPTAVADTNIFISQDGFYDAINDVGDPGFCMGYNYDGISSSFVIGSAPWHTGIPFPIGQWNHIALVVNSAFEGRLFLNGVQIDSMTASNLESYYTCNNGSGNPFQLGAFWNNNFHFGGNIDEVRIWNIQRTPAEIKAGMYGTVSAATPGLLAYYKMEEGTGTTVVNSSAPGSVDLTLQNGVAWSNGPAVSNPNGLTFDNTVNTQVSAPANTNYDFNAGTIEFDVQPGSLVGNLAAIANRSGAGSRWSIHMTNTFGNNLIGIYNNVNGFASVSYPAGFTAGTWYHVSLVTNANGGSDTTGVYVNGEYVGQIPIGYNEGLTGQPLTIGANGVDGSENWIGGIDEVRLWNTPLTQAQIKNNIGQTLTGSETGLVGYWNFDQGISNSDNTGLKVAVDNTVSTNNGLLSNFALTGSTSNYMTHTLVPLPVTFGRFTVTKQGESALLQWQTFMESNTKDFVIERSGNGVNYTDIGSIEAAGNSRTVKNYSFVDANPLEGNNYYRIHERDLDLKSTYSDVKILAFTKAGNLIWYTTGAKTAEVRLQKGSTELYSITDLSGHVIRSGRLSGGTTTLSGVSGGIYFVKVINAAGAELVTKVLIP